MDPISLVHLSQISSKIVRTFSEIEQLCHKYEASHHKNEPLRLKAHDNAKKDKEDKTIKDREEKPLVRQESAKKRDNETPSKSKPVKKPHSPSPPAKESSSEQAESENADIQQKAPEKKKVNAYPDAPKKPMGSYLLFLKERKPKILTILSHLTMTEISQVVGKEWKALTNQQKEVYTHQYEETKAKYKVELAEYKKIHPGYDENEKKKKKKARLGKTNDKKNSKISVSEDSESEKQQQEVSVNNDDDSMGEV